MPSDSAHERFMHHAGAAFGWAASVLVSLFLFTPLLLAVIGEYACSVLCMYHVVRTIREHYRFLDNEEQ